jgi:hypothetical protein
MLGWNQRVKPPRWLGLMRNGTPAPACRRSVSVTTSLGAPNTWMLVVANRSGVAYVFPEG